MASAFGRILTGKRIVPPMEYALAGLLIAISIAGNAMGLDYKMRVAASDLIAVVYVDGSPDARGVPIPDEVVVSVRAEPAYDGIQAQVGKKP